ncbi:hypothetical protein PFHG_05439 [Plasmodium falciparum HB3]|uniref:Uncharacterized protein n=1 Tax=Plasmodium falciparum (isolate HB3) TaxID=137071 RepID=A0A0L7KM70_PLAFX|nr:hypothetical protein PFHG_05439 [Plasmodium falciparum HB3]
MKRTQVRLIKNARCAANIDPPTYFDYVPQYLRWFEEWAEDFCRKRKHKLENAIKICRGENGKDKYCDRYGLDCERTKYKIGYLVEGNDCHKCSVPCKRFVEWIAKQKKEFEKQKKKYRKEIDQKNDKTIKTRYGTINNLYADQFYTELKKNYQDVDSFLEKLNDEAICKKPPKVEDEKADHVDFKKESHTFSPTEYCDPCPDCGVKRKSDGSEKWEAKSDTDCAKEIEKTITKENTTIIPVLTPEKKKTSILQKYKNFCDNAENNKQIEKWTCHYEGTNRNNCILGEWENFKQDKTFRSYHSFFYGSFTEMLKDSIDWRTYFKSCINNNKNTCRKGCHDKCECYKRWVEKKKKEFEGIKEHFRKQEDLLKDIQNVDPNVILIPTLSDNFQEDMKNAHDDSEEIAETCKKCQEPQKPQEQEQATRASWSLRRTPRRRPHHHLPVAPKPGTPPQAPVDPHGEDDDEEEEEEEENEVAETAVEGEGSVPQEEGSTTTTPRDTNKFSDACKLKYGPGGKEKFPNWKCVTPSGDEKSGGKDGATGGLCIPPRRRRLYVTPLTKLTGGDGTTQSSQPKEAGAPQVSPSATSSGSQSDPLLTAFVESAAVETFFLWHKYKMEKKKEKEEAQENVYIPTDENDEEQKQITKKW